MACNSSVKGQLVESHFDLTGWRCATLWPICYSLWPTWMFVLARLSWLGSLYLWNDVCMCKYCTGVLLAFSLFFTPHSLQSSIEPTSVSSFDTMGPVPAAAAAPANGNVKVGEDLVKPACDKLAYRVVQLPNNLKVLLIHDPETDKAAAALDVSMAEQQQQLLYIQSVPVMHGVDNAEQLLDPLFGMVKARNTAPRAHAFQLQ